MLEKEKRGQVTLYIIIALAIVVLIAGFFIFRGYFGLESLPSEVQPVYQAYISCIEQNTRNGVSLLHSQGGRIELGNYVPGSDYAPFSSHLNFLGVQVPYWYYLTGNGLVKENLPTKNSMEQELGDFIEEKINDCVYDDFILQGYSIEYEEPRVTATINDNEVLVDVASEVSVSKGDVSGRRGNHDVRVTSKLGSLYNDAVEIYNTEKEEAFLEEYAVDVLRLNAPVDGVEIQCNPVIWESQKVVSDLDIALENNIQAIKFKGRYYSLDEENDNYFVVDKQVNNQVNFIYSRDWPRVVEITPGNNNVLMAQPIGNQNGLGVLGFCYVPYHFVYDVKFPVMVQVGDGTEYFQFPVSVIVDNNLPRQVDLTSLENNEPEFSVCDVQGGQATISVRDETFRPVEGRVSFECLKEVCELGESEIQGNAGVLITNLPQCVNGKIIVNAEGYRTAEKTYSSTVDGNVEIFMEREYEVDVDLNGVGLSEGDFATINFVRSDGETITAIFPDNDKIQLSEGEYAVTAYVYGDADINIPASKKSECVEVSRGGILGMFGATKEECFDIEVPAVNIDTALIGGGKVNTYLLESKLSSGKLTLNVPSLPKPRSLEQLQYNTQAFEELEVVII